MLLSLAVRNFVIVDALALDFAPGLTVLTGETGAGKSILIDALLLALGERAEADVLRDPGSRAEIVAEFRPHAAALNWLHAADLDADGDVLLLRRTVDPGGRSKAWINGSPATLAQLREVGELLVDVHGQHAHQSLLRPAAQLQLLDEHGGLTAQAQVVAERYARWRQAARARAEAEAMAGAAQREEERLRWIVEELGALAPQPGEWDAIEAEHRRLTHAASLLEGAQAAVDALAEADDAALVRIDGAAARLAQLAGYDDRLQPVVQALEAARIQVDEAARELNHYLGRTEVDDRRLAEAAARVAALHAAGRKYKCAPAALPARLAEAQGQLAALAAATDMAALHATEAAAEADYRQLAQALSADRAQAAAAMSLEVTRAMQDLAMPGGRFEVHLEPADPAASGLERAEFRVAGHAGVAPKPLAKVASGGELARISLAISVIAATATPVATLIFDEVDAGVGGAVAETVGRLLAQLGREWQVLAVTHLPQVAARGDQHYVVGKEAADDGRPATRIALLERAARVEEIARMLGGIEITATTRKHAREMLAG
ncbi:MAG: DNA repair protein RecN [Betaproteobacteria bacterium]